MFIGCLLAIAIGLMPRFALILAWLFSARWDLVWDSWFWPLLGILFLPYTTVMYMLAWTVGTGVVGWDWMWVVYGSGTRPYQMDTALYDASAGARLSGVRSVRCRGNLVVAQG